MDDKKSVLIEKIKTIIIELAHYSKDPLTVNREDVNHVVFPLNRVATRKAERRTFVLIKKVIMKKVFYLIPAGLLFFSASVTAQQANIDSLKLVAQISQDQLQLGKLQNMVAQKTKDQEGAALNAQNSASDNANAAQRLNDDPTNKKLASNASDKAGDAKSDARKSRKQTEKLDDLNQSIKDLKSKIAGEQYKLSIYSPASSVTTPIAMPTPASSDTTLHP